MATADGNGRRTPLAQIQGLVRPHLDYDSERNTYRPLETASEIAATHGASIGAIARLAHHGKFTGGLTDEFFLTPNLEFNGWDASSVAKDIAAIAVGYKKDAVLISIGYAETDEEAGFASHSEHDVGEVISENHGVVIAFHERVLRSSVLWHEDPLREEYELALTYPPIIETIEGIYPIDKLAENALQQTLAFLETSTS